MHFPTVVPAHAGIQYTQAFVVRAGPFHVLRANWMPACAGTTTERDDALRHQDWPPRERPSAAARAAKRRGSVLVGVAQNQSVHHIQDCLPNAVLNLICS
jgi:hypothetical protein